MSFEYLTDSEYQQAFHRFGNIRKGIAELVLSATDGQARMIMDIPAGHGYLAAECTRFFPYSQFLCIGLRNDVESHMTLRGSTDYPKDVWSHINYLSCDALELPFSDDSFDLVINFLGLEDIKMTRGVEGVKNALSEMTRVLDPPGTLQISCVEYGDLPEEKLARDIWTATGLNPVFETREWYIHQLEELGLRLDQEKQFIYPKKMTASQAEEELRFACEVAPSLFSEFGVSAKSFDSLWSEYESRVQLHGMAYWSRIRALVFKLETA